MSTQPHLLLSEGEIPEIALLPGDPGRVDHIADRCEDVTTHSRNREFKVVSGVYGSTPLTICSTGIGCPSAAIALEELANVGVETVLRVGTTGALQSHMDIGDCVVATGAAKNEGTSKRYEAVEYPAVPDHDVLNSLVSAAKETDWPVHVGPIVSDDAYYAETDEYVADWEQAGLLAVEMEAAVVFTLGRRRGLRAGAICTVDGNLVRGTQKGVNTEDTELPEGAQGGVDRAIDIALSAVETL
ncbi:MAG: nucleoside phosphorylase [Natrialbaceae archaeon]|nr:nucleoside phosphorylase [Natrialbaceae archaeon]